MALTKCPECGKENVSDSAEACPDCGYGIKAHFEKIKQDIEQKEQAEKRKIEAELKAKKQEEAIKNKELNDKRKEEQRVRSVPQLEKPQLKAPIIILVISALCFWIGISESGASEWEVERSVSHGNGDPHFYGALFVFIGIGLICYGIYLFVKRLERYNLSKTNLEEYQRQVIKERAEAAEAARRSVELQARAAANAPKCPMCNSTNIERISTLNRATSVAMTGLASGKIGKQYKCKHMW
ncbi:zinc ribbon domain-containing protein [Anaerosporobacter sp.]|uniref:zinc ribbon domain-containing protein n=1 Tax=Anaerosporobacter sp. TaxID=1872529 RepID=UPI00286F2B60|nr:zinc ribbon domain-containing protein [Anaerosporobacter sp.]